MTRAWSFGVLVVCASLWLVAAGHAQEAEADPEAAVPSEEAVEDRPAVPESAPAGAVPTFDELPRPLSGVAEEKQTNRLCHGVDRPFAADLARQSPLIAPEEMGRAGFESEAILDDAMQAWASLQQAVERVRGGGSREGLVSAIQSEHAPAFAALVDRLLATSAPIDRSQQAYRDEFTARLRSVHYMLFVRSRLDAVALVDEMVAVPQTLAIPAAIPGLFPAPAYKVEPVPPKSPRSPRNVFPVDPDNPTAEEREAMAEYDRNRTEYDALREVYNAEVENVFNPAMEAHKLSAKVYQAAMGSLQKRGPVSKKRRGMQCYVLGKKRERSVARLQQDGATAASIGKLLELNHAFSEEAGG